MSDNNRKSLKRQRLVPYSPSASSSDDRKTNSSSSSHNVIIKATDMKEDMQTEAVNIATAAFEKDSQEKDVAQQIKEAFDKNHGPTLHCILGRNFETSNKMSDNNSKSLKRLMPSSPSASSSDDRETNSSPSSCNVIIKATDMKEDMQTEAVRIAKAAFENDRKEKDVAEQIKKAFDKNHGPTWHCIVGRDFGSYVTHERNHFVYFILDSRAVLLFKSG